MTKAIERLLSLGYIDDKARALSLKTTSIEAKNLGRAGAMSYMRRMGIERGEAEEALSDYDEFEAAGRLIRKRLRTTKAGTEDVVRRRLFDALRRRGFSTETIMRALKKEEAR